MTILFISDLHLDATRPFITQHFLMFLNNMAPKSEALFILGDFFETWIGDDYHTPHHQMVITALAQLADKGIPIYLMHGNRDFLIGEQFAKAARCTLIPDPYVIDLYGIRTVLMHGDSLCTLDKGHQRYRAITRQPFIRNLFLNLPLAWRQKIAMALRHRSQQKFIQSQTMLSRVSIDLEAKQQHDDRYNVTETAVHAVLKKYQATCLIHGHTHIAGIHKFKVHAPASINPTNDDALPAQCSSIQCNEHNGFAAKRIVLGEWGSMGNVLVASKESFELKDF